MDPIEETGSHKILEEVGMESDSLEPVDAAEAIGVTRRRQRTEEGEEFITHIRWTDCQSITRRVRRQIKEIDSLETSEENAVVVVRNLTSFRITVEELKICVAALLNDLETEDDLNIVNDWYAQQSDKINSFIEKTVCWISSAKEAIKESLETRSS